ncbi:DUF1801 domain-containing protein [Pedobacter polaris]|uniref:DUF1801 domain-containing protein n=1 Tax=Pedobacter polaris TaxID=2571273 RepID=A0A4U1CVA0_9SPHI|nr:DUF1801 domain-containing protein [Pedobacter polaris]TKC12060.1 DUF1801 domain-containing protein [Pedobacter polaris]
MAIRPIHPDFLFLLGQKEKSLIELFCDLREFVLEINPNSNELLYHTHALTSVFSISEKLGDAFCMIPIYANHLNLGFNKGTLLKDPHQLLTGTGNLIRHIPVKQKNDYRNKEVKALISEAINFVIKDIEKPTKSIGKTITKIKS